MKMYKIIVKSYTSSSSTYSEDFFSNKIDGTFIFNTNCINTVLENVAGEIIDMIKTNGYYGGTDKNISAHIEVVDEPNLRGYISFSCKKVNMMVVVNFIEV